MKVLLADDHPLFLEGLQNLLHAKGYQVVGTARDGCQALELARALHPDVILMDVRMSPCNGLTATRLVKAEMPEIKVLMLTTSTDDDDLFEALKSGASGYMLKTLDSTQLFDCLAGLERGEAPLSRELSARLLSEFAHQADQLRARTPDVVQGEPDQDLTPRQRQILERVAAGLSYKEVGVALNISEHTVKYHMAEILDRLHVKNRERAVAHALRNGLVRAVRPGREPQSSRNTQRSSASDRRDAD